MIFIAHWGGLLIWMAVIAALLVWRCYFISGKMLTSILLLLFLLGTGWWGWHPTPAIVVRTPILSYGPSSLWQLSASPSLHNLETLENKEILVGREFQGWRLLIWPQIKHEKENTEEMIWVKQDALILM